MRDLNCFIKGYARTIHSIFSCPYLLIPNSCPSLAYTFYSVVFDKFFDISGYICFSNPTISDSSSIFPRLKASLLRDEKEKNKRSLKTRTAPERSGAVSYYVKLKQLLVCRLCDRRRLLGHGRCLLCRWHTFDNVD